MSVEKLILLFVIVVLPVVSLAVRFGRSRGTKGHSIDKNEPTMGNVTLLTKDTISLAGLYWPGRGTRGAVLLHMMPSTKESWLALGPKLAQDGRHVIAIDLRGHGTSAGGPKGFESFSKEDHQKSRLDVEAAVDFLKSKGVKGLVMVGASIGANLAMEYAVDHPDVEAAVMLSAGLNYYGIETMPVADRARPELKLLFAASEGDMRKDGNDAAAMAQQLYLALSDHGQKKLLVYHNAGHGTDMFGKESPDLEETILNWLR